MRGRKRVEPSESRPKTVVGYVRVSSEEQAAEGVSLAAQEERLRAYAVATGREIAEIVSDAGVSAKSLHRPGLQRILEGVRQGEIGAVIVLKLDRLTRSVRDLGELLELFAGAQADLVSVSESLDTSSAAGRMVTNMLGVVAQWEREVIAERTSFALAHKRRKREAYGHEPFGYRREGAKLVPVPEHISALSRMKRMHVEGASLREIANWLTAQQIPPRQGGRAWYAASVARVLNSRMASEVEVLHLS